MKKTLNCDSTSQRLKFDCLRPEKVDANSSAKFASQLTKSRI